MRNLLGRLWTHNRVFIVACALVLGLFQFLLCALVAEVNLESAFEQILQFAPPVMRSMIEQSMLGGSTQSVLAFGWNHPITHALLAAVAIAPASRAVAGEVESGVIELVLAQPLSRARYLGAHVVFGLAAICLVTVAGAAGTWIGQHVFSLEAFPVPRLLHLLLNLVLLQAAIYAGTLLVSAWSREAGRAAMAGVLIALVSYLVNVIATLLEKAAFLEPYSLHSYYDPRALLVRGELPWYYLLVLSGCALLAIVSSFWHFARRDLP